MEKISAAITAIGGYVPEDVLSNAMLEQMVQMMSGFTLVQVSENAVS